MLYKKMHDKFYRHCLARCLACRYLKSTGALQAMNLVQALAHFQ